MKCNKENVTDFALPIPSVALLAVANADSCLSFSASFSLMNMNTDSLRINHKKKQTKYIKWFISALQNAKNNLYKSVK